MKPSLRAQRVVLNEELQIMASCFLSLISRKILAVIQERCAEDRFVGG